MRAVLLCLCTLTTLASAQQPDSDALLKSAITEQQRGDYDAAIRDYRKILDLYPDMVEAKVNLGAALVRVGQFDAAIAMYRSALPSLSFKNPVLLNLGLAYYKKGDFANANEQFTALHSLQPGDIQVAILLGDTQVRTGKPLAAIALLEPLSRANSQNLDFQYVYGSALIGAGQFHEGVSLMEKVAAANNSADAYLLAGATLLRLNDFEPARHNLEAALRLDPKLPNIYTLVGTARDKTGDVTEAERAFREALKGNPDDFDANLYLGAILYKRRELESARPYLERALALNPSNSMVRYEFAMLKSASGDYAAATSDLETLVKNDPDWLEPHVELASLYYKLHRAKEGAKERQIVERLTAEQQEKGPGKE